MTRCSSNLREFRIIGDGRLFLPQWRWSKPSWYQSADWRSMERPCHYLSSAESVIKSWQHEDADWFEVELKEALVCDISS